MKILITNDDGVSSPVLGLLKDHLQELGDIKIVAPLTERSSCGHGLSLGRPVFVETLGNDFYGIDGLPADCVFVALSMLYRDGPPDLVLSGINRGGNLGQDLYYSGTAAAARQAAFFGIPSMATSLTLEFKKERERVEDYFTPIEIIKEMIKQKIHLNCEEGEFLNVNFPVLKQYKGIQLTNPGYRYYGREVDRRVSPRNKGYYWIEAGYSGFRPTPNTDCLAIDEGFVSVSLVGGHLTPDSEHGKNSNRGLIDTIKFLNEKKWIS